MKILLLILGASLVGARPDTVPVDVENKAWDAKKLPVLTESAPSEKHSAAEWKKAQSVPTPKCGKTPVWKVSPKSVIEATATKEKTVAVKGKFTRFLANAIQTDHMLRGSGFLDLSSYDSGLPARDHRVRKYVFGVEEKGNAVLPFEWAVESFTPAVASWKSALVLKFQFRGQQVQLRVPAQFQAKGRGIHVTSETAQRFTFLTSATLPAFGKLIELCNHQFLGSYADVSVDLTLENVCPR